VAAISATHFDELNGLKNRDLADALYRLIKEYFGAWTRLASRWVFRVFYGLCLLASLLVGEMFALAALMDPHPETAGHPRPVLAAVTAGLVGIGLVALLGSREKKDP
jgi:hypothetical protein